MLVGVSLGKATQPGEGLVLLSQGGHSWKRLAWSQKSREVTELQIVYILGSTRSGTSALRNAIATTRFAGYGEGHLVPLLQKIVEDVRDAKATGIGHDVQGNGVAAMRENILIRHFFFGYELYLERTLDASFIIDKTPTIDPIRFAPELNKFHQDAKFLHCSRRHVDNIISKQKKFPKRSVEQHSVEWAHCNLAWLESREKLNGNFVQFDFHDLTNFTEDISEKIGDYLNLDKGEKTSLLNYLVGMRPETEEKRDLRSFAKLSETPWSEEERDAFVNICNPIGERLGYGMETYFS
jgi:hypothetical protein